jgi:hypothetical protein
MFSALKIVLLNGDRARLAQDNWLQAPSGMERKAPKPGDFVIGGAHPAVVMVKGEPIAPVTYGQPVPQSPAPSLAEIDARLKAARAARANRRPSPRRQGEAMIVIGQALRMRYQLHELARRHRIPDSAPIATMVLLEPVEHDLIVEGLAATADGDRHHMKFRPWLPWKPKPPLLFRHAEPAGELLDMQYDERGRLFVRARVTHHRAARASCGEARRPNRGWPSS